MYMHIHTINVIKILLIFIVVYFSSVYSNSMSLTSPTQDYGSHTVAIIDNRCNQSHRISIITGKNPPETLK